MGWSIKCVKQGADGQGYIAILGYCLDFQIAKELCLDMLSIGVVCWIGNKE